MSIGPSLEHSHQAPHRFVQVMAQPAPLPNCGQHSPQSVDADTLRKKVGEASIVIQTVSGQALLFNSFRASIVIQTASEQALLFKRFMKMFGLLNTNSWRKGTRPTRPADRPTGQKWTVGLTGSGWDGIGMSAFSLPAGRLCSMVPWMESEIEVKTNIAFLWLPPCPHSLILKGSSCFLGFLLLTPTQLPNIEIRGAGFRFEDGAGTSISDSIYCTRVLTE